MAPTKKASATSDNPSTPATKRSASLTASASPLKKLKAARQRRTAARVARDEIVLSTVDDFRDYVVKHESSGDAPNPDIEMIVRGTFLWASEHTYGGRRLVRLHMTDAEPEETLEELMEFKEAHGASDDDRIDADALLLTIALFGETLQSPKLPQSGAVVRMAHSRKRTVFDGRFCQMVTRITDLIME